MGLWLSNNDSHGQRKEGRVSVKIENSVGYESTLAGTGPIGNNDGNEKDS